MLLNDCSTEFMKHVLPKFRSPTTFRSVFRFCAAVSPLSLDKVRLRGRNLRPIAAVDWDGGGSGGIDADAAAVVAATADSSVPQPESLDDVLRLLLLLLRLQLLLFVVCSAIAERFFFDGAGAGGGVEMSAKNVDVSDEEVSSNGSRNSCRKSSNAWVLVSLLTKSSQA